MKRRMRNCFSLPGLALGRLREETMLEYDPNLPQEFGPMPKRARSSFLIIALALATVLLVYALVALLPIVSRYQV